MRQYECMFLFDPTYAAEFAKPEAEIKRILDRAQAEIVFCRKYDERKLAYEIKGLKRGTYVLTYFRAQPDRIVAIEHDIRLSEVVLRHLILSAEGVAPERMSQFAAEARVHAIEEERPHYGDRPPPRPAERPAVAHAEPQATREEEVVASAAEE